MLEKEKETTLEGSITGHGGLKEKKKVSWLKSILLVVFITLGGGFFVLNTFALTITKAEVQQTYRDYTCGKSSGDDAGVDYWVRTINSSKNTKADLIYALEHSSAYCKTPPPTTQPKDGTATTTDPNAAAIRAAYCAELGREASSADITYWAARLTPKGSWSVAQMTKQLDSSSEGKKHNETPDKSSCAGGGGGSTTVANCDPSKANQVADPKARPGYTYHDINVEFVRDAYNKYTTTAVAWDDFAAGSPQDTYVKNLDACKTTQAKVIAELKQSASGQARVALEKKRAEYTAQIKAAYASALRKALAKQGGKFNEVNPLMRWDLCAELAANGSNDIPGFCFNGVGLPFPAVDALVAKVISGQMTIEEALSIANNPLSAPDPCAYAIGHGDSPVCMGSQGAGNVVLKTDRVLPTVGGNADANRGPKVGRGIPITRDNVGEVTTNDFAPVENPTTAAVSQVTEDTKPTQTATSASVCANDNATQTCTTVPLGNNKASDVANDKSGSGDVVPIGDSGACLELLCKNENTQEWSYSNRERSDTKTSTAVAKVAPSEVSNCVDKYETLLPGDDSPCVLVAHIYLWLTGYLTANPDSTQFDAAMKTAVIAFQKDHKINPADGTISKSTWDALKKAAGDAQQAKKASADDQRAIVETTTLAAEQNAAIILPNCSNQSALAVGSTGECVKRVQQILVLVQGSDLKISGTYDSSTEQAVKIFQDSHNLRVTGVVNKDTWRLLEIAAVPAVHKSPFQSAQGILINGRSQ